VEKATKRICVILNPTAANGKAQKRGRMLERILKSRGYDTTVLRSEYAQHAVELAGESARKDFDIIAAAGGDGTVNEVVWGLMDAALAGVNPPAFALFPIGRGNDFAFAAGIPHDIESCCRLIEESPLRPVDVGRMDGGLYPEGRYFINGIGVGFEPLVNVAAGKFKRVGGVLSYLLGFLRVMASYPAAVEVEMVIDEQSTGKVSTQQLSICNGRRMGGSFLMGPDALIDDGLLDLGYVNRPVSMGGIVKMVGKFFRGRQKSHPFFSGGLIRSLDLHADRGGLVCHADGEMIAYDTDHLHIEVVPGALLLAGSRKI
jgi:YegS/Rv2252/BmrU family lipid kinase